MSYRLEAGESIAEGIQRVAREQIDKALRSIEDEEDRNEAIHDVRKRLKKLRALLRLVRDEIGEEVYQAENVCFRDAGRLLSDARDSYVFVETVDYLKEQFDDLLYAAALDGVRGALLERHEASLAAHLDEGENALDEVRAIIEAARTRVADWPVERDTFGACRDGLRRVYRRGRERFADAQSDPTPEALHEWRKRVKYLWYHTRLLRNVWHDPMKVLAHELHDLSDILGDEHDLSELRELLIDEPGLCGSTEEMNMLLGLMDQQRAYLRATAWPLAHRLYHEKTDDFVDRIAAYWTAWEQPPHARTEDPSPLQATAAIHG